MSKATYIKKYNKIRPVPGQSLGNPSKTTLRIFSVKGVPPPSTPLTENHFAKKSLAERGVRKVREAFPEFFFP